jgi:hypothetical protein
MQVRGRLTTAGRAVLQPNELLEAVTALIEKQAVPTPDVQDGLAPASRCDDRLMSIARPTANLDVRDRLLEGVLLVEAVVQHIE